MKLTAILMIVGCLQVSANGFAQGKITMKKANATLEEVLVEINKQTGVLYSANNETLKKAGLININVRNEDLKEVLRVCFEGQPLVYSLKDNIIIVKEKSTPIKVTIVDERNPIDVRGKVTDEKGNPVQGVTVTIKGTNKQTLTDENGEFSLSSIDKEAVLLFTSVNMETFEVRVNGQAEMVVKLKAKVRQMSEVIVSTGYQNIPRERATGSFSVVNNQLLNRRVGSNLLDRVENLVPGILFDRNTGAPDPILIRGRSTILGDAKPLIILDNFPYDGDINNINPNDVESITILKDASAASIWGARAGNGVIVITRKTGTNKKTQVQINSNFTIQNKPDVFNIPVINSSEYIDLEKSLFEKGFYNTAITSQNQAALSPVVEILLNKKNGLITESEADSQIDMLRENDYRRDLDKYFFRRSMMQQYSINMSGTNSNISYYLSAGWDRLMPSTVGQKNDRITIRSQNIFTLTKRLKIAGGINFTYNTNKGGDNQLSTINSGGGKKLYPYAMLADDAGNAVKVVRDYRSPWIDTVGKGAILDWSYKPLEEINNSVSDIKLRDFVINTSIKYDLTKGLNAEFYYQYENQLIANSLWRKQQSYFARDLINRYYQPNASIKFPVPIGGIMDNQNNEIISHQGRLQLNYANGWGDHGITGLAGFELKNIQGSGETYKYYGYNPDLGSSVNANMDFTTAYPQYQWGTFSQFAKLTIPNLQSISKGTDRYVSYFANLAYSYRGIYTLNASARRDASNLFGVKTNQKWVPLWSAGVSYLISKEEYYKTAFVPFLKIRATYGYQGNALKIASALPTATYEVSKLTALNMANIQNPPNKSLRWERVGTLNLGLDFGLKDNILKGSIEYYKKRASDLLVTSPHDPTTGVSSLLGNIGSMSGDGIDLQLESDVIRGKFVWQVVGIFSKAFTKVTKYNMPISGLGRTYLDAYFNPVIGRPLYSLYSFYWGGLDTSGNPVGYLGKQLSTDYSNILAKTKLDSLSFAGSTQPTFYGSFRNNFQLGNFELSINISYKFGYYFRKASIDYGDLFNTWSGHSDYSLRWKEAGDENFTSVPAIIYPANTNRDYFYNKSSVLVRKGDHIRLEDITLSYNLDKPKFTFLPFQHLKIYFYANNLGTLWVANKEKLDPYFLNSPANGKSFSFGVNMSL